MSHQEIYPVPGEFEKNSLINDAKYQEMYKASIENPQEFWAQQAKELLDWESFPTKIMNADFHEAQIKWFEDGVLNVSYNCIDRHLEKKGDDVAIIWEGDDCNDSMHISYKELHKKVCQFANILRARGIKKGDRVAIYMPMIPEASYAMLACARIGAVHSVVFGGFSPEAIKARIQDSECAAVITADEGRRAGKRVPLKKNVDLALNDCPSIHTCLVVQSTGGEVIMQDGRDIWYHQALESASLECDPEPMNAEDPFFILYTSGSTGTPKGVLHTTGGYLLYATMTFKYVFDYHDGDVYWCTADVGWITGHSYLLYGPLSCGATTLMFEGVPDYPTPSRIWEVVDKHQVNVVYTAPTAIRALMRHGNDPVKATSRRSLRILGTVGEPINPEAWSWYYEVVGEERCPIVDTWWQTETGGHMITALPGATALKPGSATRPFFGVEPVILDGDGKVLDGAADGYLMIKSSWPGQMRGIYGNHERFKETYFGMFPGYYLTGDSAKRDSDGYYWITGRIDDVMNVSGHRMGTAEVESALVLHPKIAEAAVVGFPHEIKGQGIYAYVTLMAGAKPSDELYDELVKLVRTEIGPIAKPDIIQWAPGLPKTRSGKIMRRILRKIAEDEFDSLGDTSTLADPSVIDYLVKQHKILKQIMLDKNKV